MPIFKFFKLIFSVAVSFLAGAVGSIFTVSGVNSWYQSINKPFFTPPNWLFGPVWLSLYVLIGLAFFLVIDNWQKTPEQKKAVSLFIIQLCLNAGWSLIFFGLHQIEFALFEILLLLLFIVLTALSFFRVKKLAGYLMLPYIFWVSFATVLNFAFWLIN